MQTKFIFCTNLLYFFKFTNIPTISTPFVSGIFKGYQLCHWRMMKILGINCLYYLIWIKKTFFSIKKFKRNTTVKWRPATFIIIYMGILVSNNLISRVCMKFNCSLVCHSTRWKEHCFFHTKVFSNCLLQF